MAQTLTCKFCCKFFFLAAEMHEHERLHVENKQLACSICGVGFARRSYLSEHMHIHKGMQPHVCPYCDKPFSLRVNLVRHVRVHTGKPYSCGICTQSFSLKKNMIEHERIHTGERPHPCPHCKLTFARRSSLVRHARTHTTEKFFQCHECDKYFPWKYYLTRHISTHQKNNTRARKRRTEQETAANMAIRSTWINDLPVAISDIKIEESHEPCQPCVVLLPGSEDVEITVKLKPIDDSIIDSSIREDSPLSDAGEQFLKIISGTTPLNVEPFDPGMNDTVRMISDMGEQSLNITSGTTPANVEPFDPGEQSNSYPACYTELQPVPPVDSSAVISSLLQSIYVPD